MLATATPSEGINPEYFLLMAVLFYSSILVAVIAVVVWRFLNFRTLVLLAFSIAAVLLSIFPMVFSGYVHHLDFVEIAMDGSPASGPYWKSLLLPAIPMIVGCVLSASALMRIKRHP